MPSTKKSRQRNQIVYGLVGAALIGILIWGYVSDWNFNVGTVGFTATPSYIDTTVSQKNNATNAETDEDVTRTWFKCDITEMDADDIEALVFADFDQMASTGERIEDIDLDEFIYILKINGTGYQTKWLCTSSLVADGKMGLLSPGENPIELYMTPSTYSMLAFPTNMPNATTVNLTDYEDWTVSLYTIDGNGEATNKVGFEPYYDFENAVDYKTVITFTFNTTVVTSDVKITTGYSYTKILSATTTVQFLIDCDYTTGESFSFELAAELGTDWELESIASGYGYEGSVTTAVTQ